MAFILRSCLMLTLTLCLTQTKDIGDMTRYQDKLLPNLGISFTSITAFYPAKEKLNFNLHIAIPELSTLLDILIDQRYLTFQSYCVEHSRAFASEAGFTRVLIQTVCDNFKKQFESYMNALHRTRAYVLGKLKTLLDYMPHLKDYYHKLQELVTKPPTEKSNKSGMNKRSITKTIIVKQEVLDEMRRKRVKPIEFTTVITDPYLQKNCLVLRRRFGSHSQQMQNNCHLRKKRFLGFAFTVANTAMNAYRTFHLQKRLKSMQKDIQRIRSVARRQQRQILLLYMGLQALAEATKTELTLIHQAINETNARIDYFMEGVKQGFIVLEESIHTLDKRDRITQLMSNLQTNLALLFNALHELRTLIVEEFDKLLSGFHTLHTGHIPPEFIPVEVLNDLLMELNQQIGQKYEGYELLSFNAIDYYALDSVLWGIQGDDIIINLPVYLKERNQQDLQLMKVESFPVPWNIREMNENPSETRSADYTKIILEYTYIAIGTHAYILIRESVLSDCFIFSGYKICSDVMLHAHKASPSCLSTLYYEDQMSLVQDYCEIRYYRNIIPPSLVYEDEHFLLLTNVHKEWRILCDKINFPFPREGRSYALLAKSTLCQCQLIIGKDLFIAKKIQGCSNTEFKLEFWYPVNAVTMYSFRNMITEADENYNYFKSKKDKIEYDVPSPKIVENLNRSKILYEPPAEAGVALDKVVELIQQNQEAFLEESDMVEQLLEETQEDEGISDWFDLDKIELGLTFCMSMFGLISLLIAIPICYKQCKQKAVGSRTNGFTSHTYGQSRATRTE